MIDDWCVFCQISHAEVYYGRAFQTRVDVAKRRFIFYFASEWQTYELLANRPQTFCGCVDLFIEHQILYDSSVIEKRLNKLIK